MKNTNLSDTAFRDYKTSSQTFALAGYSSWQQLRANDGRAECFEIALRFLLVACVGVAMLCCGVQRGPVPMVAAAHQSSRTFQPMHSVVEAVATAALPQTFGKGTQKPAHI